MLSDYGKYGLRFYFFSFLLKGNGLTVLVHAQLWQDIGADKPLKNLQLIRNVDNTMYIYVT